MDASTFFEILFGDLVSPERQLVIFEGGTLRSHWCSEIPEAVEICARVSPRTDVYFGVALHNRAQALEEARLRGKERPENTRGCSASARVIGGVWADVDVENEHHKKLGLPKSISSILHGLYAMPHIPSIAVGTGGGVHAWWVFREPYEIESDKERSYAVSIVEGWQRLIANSSGWTVDPTADLGRVLRVPGTINHKYAATVAVIGDDA